MSKRNRTRNAKGQFVRELPTLEERTRSMMALYEWREGRRQYTAQLAKARHEERFGGLRSLAIATAMSAVLVVFLIAGVSP